MTRILITGAAGFIGAHVARALLEQGHRVTGLDNLDPYYDPTLKQARLDRLLNHDNFDFRHVDIADRHALDRAFDGAAPGWVLHFAAQVGVRHSLLAPHDYLRTNLMGFGHVLEACRRLNVQHLVHASSSSVYGAYAPLPFREEAGVDHPVSLYGATKRSGELMAHSYAHLHGLPSTGLRFFTVYGPWGRPDMALFRFTRAMLAGEPLRVFGQGQMQRSFTTVSDVVDRVLALLPLAPQPQPGFDGAHPDPAHSAAPFRVLNVGHPESVPLMTVIHALERAIGRKAILRFEPKPAADLNATRADGTALAALLGDRPWQDVHTGVPEFVRWYRSYYGD